MLKELEKILKHVSKHIIQSEEIINTYKNKDIVTNNDLKAERYIISEIKKLKPNDLFISEEENHAVLTEKPTWIIDPIDGTLNYSRGIPQYGIQLAYYEQSEALLSMMYFPESDVLIYAKKNKGCYINHQRVTIDPKPLDQSIITFGDFSRSQPSSRPKQLELMSRLMDHVMKIRIYGASSSDFSYVVLNKTQCHIIFTKRIWELAAGQLLATEAGLSVVPLKYDDCEGLMIGHIDVLNALTEITK